MTVLYRAGRGGRAVTLVTQYDVQLLQAIEARTGKKMERFADADEEAALTMMGKVRQWVLLFEG